MTRKEMESLFFDSPEWYKIHEEILNNDEYKECNPPGPLIPLPRKRCYPSRGIVEFYKYSPGYSLILWRGFRYVAEIYMASGIDGKVSSAIYIKLNNDHYLSNYGIPGDHETSLYQIIMNYTNETV